MSEVIQFEEVKVDDIVDILEGDNLYVDCLVTSTGNGCFAIGNDEMLWIEALYKQLPEQVDPFDDPDEKVIGLWYEHNCNKITKK